jgi:hypothetical protein
VVRKAKFAVSNIFSLVNSVERVCGSDSPVKEELLTLKSLDSTIRMSAIHAESQMKVRFFSKETNRVYYHQN